MKNWNGFPVTADSRRVLIYQGDESEHDMLQALNKRGFIPGSEVRKRTEVRFGWNTDAMPILYQDAEEFRPAIIMIDSLTFVQRYSLFDENRTEYSRAVLELNKFAAETGITVVIVHHTNKNGQSRGTTAVRNAVSEVIKLEKDPNPAANAQEKILTIEKSRSRRFPASYRLFFNEEDFSFSLLEEVGQELGSPDIATKDRIVKFLQEQSNIKFEAEEIASHISTTSGNARRCLSQLARDGLVSLDERSFSGTRKLYYIARDPEYCSTENPLQSVTVTSPPRITSENDSIPCQTKENSELDGVYKNDGSPVITSMITFDDHLLNNSVSHEGHTFLSNCNEADHLSMPENAKKTELEIEEKTRNNDDQVITFVTIDSNDCIASAPNCNEADHQRRSQGDPSQPPDHLKGNSLHNSVLQTQQIEEGQVSQSFEVGDYIKITSHPTRLHALGLVQKIASVENSVIKTEFGICLNPGEFEKADATTPATSLTAISLVKTELPIPLIQEEAVYLSFSQKRKVQVFRIFDELGTISVKIEGRGIITLPFADLRCCEKSPAHDLKVRDEVVILVGKHKETFATITSISANGIFLKSDTKRRLHKAYFPHQLVKV